MKVDDK